MRAEQSPTSANAGTGTLPSASVPQTAVSTETLTIPPRTVLQAQSVAPSEFSPRGQTSPTQGPGEVPILGREPAVLPPPAAGFPERLPPSPLMAPELPVTAGSTDRGRPSTISPASARRRRRSAALMRGPYRAIRVFPQIGTTMLYARRRRMLRGSKRYHRQHYESECRDRPWTDRNS
jgi:hypothetical protein